MKVNKTIFVALLVSLFVSILINISLVVKLYESNENTNDLVGVYLLEKKGTIEILDDKRATFLNKTSTYTVEGNIIKFTYYVDFEGVDGKCYGINKEGKMVYHSCRQKQTSEVKIVDDGLIYYDNLYVKVG